MLFVYISLNIKTIIASKNHFLQYSSIIVIVCTSLFSHYKKNSIFFGVVVENTLESHETGKCVVSPPSIIQIISDSL